MSTNTYFPVRCGARDTWTVVLSSTCSKLGRHRRRLGGGLGVRWRVSEGGIYDVKSGRRLRCPENGVVVDLCLGSRIMEGTELSVLDRPCLLSRNIERVAAS
ncbi:hypothetical protein M3J09_009996 [Ascochyta lentis]